MPAAPSGLRDRRRAETVSEIKHAALAQISSGGTDSLSLRAVSRELGVSVQALYHYFDSRDALVTELVADAFNELADAVLAGGADARASHRERILGAGLAYRRWALDHRAEFLLALGAPLPGYTAPECGPTTVAAMRMGAAFRDVLFGTWTPEELARIPLPEHTDDNAPALMSGSSTVDGLPPGALGLFITGWSTLHGFVMLEAHGHLAWVQHSGEEVCRIALSGYIDVLERARAAPPVG